MNPLRLPLSAVLSLFLSLSFLVAPAHARLENRTIDDSFGDSSTGKQVIYEPQAWNNQTCTGCSIHPDVSGAFMKTYTGATYHPSLDSISIEMEFEGVAIWIYFILFNNAGDQITTLTMANFTLNGGSPALFEHRPDMTSTAVLYNQLVYSQTDLPNTNHKLLISTSGVDESVFIDFDYAVYTHVNAEITSSESLSQKRTTVLSTSTTSTSSRSNDPGPVSSSTLTSDTSATPPTVTSITLPTDPSTTHPSKPALRPGIGAMVGGIVGGIIFVALLIFLLTVLLRRRRYRQHRSILARSEWIDWPGGFKFIWRDVHGRTFSLASSNRIEDLPPPLHVHQTDPLHG